MARAGDGPDGAQLEHPALLYRSLDEFLGVMVPFVRAGVDRREFVFVAARGDNLAALRQEVGERADEAQWADTDEWHPHPSSRLRAFYELVTDELRTGRTRFRLVGEPVWPPGPPELIREWQRYESVLNSVLSPFPVTLLCLYDAGRLHPSIVATAHRTHRIIHEYDLRHPSGEFEEPERFLRRWNAEVPPPPPGAAHLAEVTDLETARRFLREQALGAGVHPARAMDLSVAANEVLTNAMVHGDGPAGLWVWADGDRFVCHIEDRGRGVGDPLAGYRPPTEATDGRGLWLARQLVDLLQILPRRSGTAVRLSVPLG